MKNEIVTAEKGRSVYFLAFLLSSFIFFTGCHDPFTSNNTANIPESKGSFSLRLSEGRTVLPTTPSLNDFAVYNLAFTSTSGGSSVSVDRTNATLSTEQILLVPGTYNLTVNAYKDSGKSQLMARGSADDILITAGQNTARAVTLEAQLSGGTGNFSWNITVPQGVTIASMVITPANVGGTYQQTVILSSEAGGSRILNSGQYSLIFNMEKTDGKSVEWNELLYVYQNLESSFTFTFTEAHFSDSSYTVTYDSNGGSNVGQQSVLHGGTLSAPTDPIKNGNTFVGWFTDNNTFANVYNFANTVTKDITLYAKWQPIPSYTVTYVYNDGVTSNQTQAVLHGTTLTNPSNPTNRHFYAISGWYTDNNIFTKSWDFSKPVLESLTLYAKWDAVNGLANKLAWLQTYAQSDTSYTIEVDADESINSYNTLSYSGRSNITITLIGVGNRIISLSSLGKMFTVGTDVTFILNNGITLQGHSENGDSLVSVNVNGTMVINTGAKIFGNNYIIYSSSKSGRPATGGGVHVEGTLTIAGGEILENKVTTTNAASYDSSSPAYGGGVYVASTGTLTMTGGKISDNIAHSGRSKANGGGVYVDSNGTFRLIGGEISDNTASCDSSGYQYTDYTISSGGGVYVSGFFSMESGKISNNKVYASYQNSSSWTSHSGGGVSVASNGTFTMLSGEINNNEVSSTYYPIRIGGGVYVEGHFTMTSGVISLNTAQRGGGVFIYGGTFTMTGGVISCNTALRYSSSPGYPSDPDHGGGVFLRRSSTPYGFFGTFNMTGGVISGNNSGGVCIEIDNYPITSSIFTKSGNSIIYGYEETGLDDYGRLLANADKAVFWQRESDRHLWRYTTLGAGVDISTDNLNIGWGQ